MHALLIAFLCFLCPNDPRLMPPVLVIKPQILVHGTVSSFARLTDAVMWLDSDGHIVDNLGVTTAVIGEF